ncbi:Transposase, partial [Rhizobium sp. RU35A]|uniref:AMP-binding protein n=1 Tax=Rhizobium sp. RU35A TaxID=1907414 RepID=UPI0009567AFD
MIEYDAVLVGVLEQFVSGASDRSLSSLRLAAPSDVALIGTFNGTAHAVEAGVLPDLLSERAAERRDAAAVVFGEDALCYDELEARSNRLARHLIGLGVGPDDVVGIALERGFDMVVSLCAVLKAGGAYLPLDPDYPAERLRYMLEDSGASVVIGSDAGLARLGLDPGADAGGPDGDGQEQAERHESSSLLRQRRSFSIADVARRHDIKPQQIYTWRRKFAAEQAEPVVS